VKLRAKLPAMGIRAKRVLAHFAEIHIGLASRSGYGELTIMDDGVGLPEERDGSGLRIVHALVSQIEADLELLRHHSVDPSVSVRDRDGETTIHIKWARGEVTRSGNKPPCFLLPQSVLNSLHSARLTGAPVAEQPLDAECDGKSVEGCGTASSSARPSPSVRASRNVSR
jgi:hypothetical protein